MADNTTLNPGLGGDVISTEDLPLGAARGHGALPLVAYKVPRSKIAVGDVDTDGGDAMAHSPLAVGDYQARRSAEASRLRAQDMSMQKSRSRQGERIATMDRRGDREGRGDR